MKGIKKLLTGVLAATMIMSASITAFATEGGEAPAATTEQSTEATGATQLTGSNTISVSGAVNGETYKAYRMLDLALADDSIDYLGATGDGYAYTLNDTWKTFWTTGYGKDFVTLHTSGSKTYVVWTGATDSTSMENFGKEAAKFAANVADNGTEVAENGEAKFTGLANGYYMVTSTLGSAVAIASTPSNPIQEIKEKNKETTTEKDVLDAESGNYVKANDAQIGDTVTFRSVVKISKNQVNVKYHDTMTKGLTWTGKDNVKVYTDEACTEANEVAAANYTVAAGTAPETFVVSFADAYVATFTEATTNLYVKYTAVLNDDAVVASPEKNTPAVTYGDNGKYEGTPTQTDTHLFKILKYDGADANKNPLDGAKFQLFENGKTTPLTLAVSANGLTYRVVDTSDAGATLPEGYTLVGEKNEIVTLATDKITIEGVDTRSYYLVETEAPVGFNKIEGNIDVVVKADNSLVVEVPNLSGSLLPSTGGIGTTIFYVLGGILIVAGVAYFILRRKADAK